MSNKTNNDEGTLTEFKVTETYYIRAKTQQDAYNQVDLQLFRDGVDNYDLQIEPSY